VKKASILVILLLAVFFGEILIFDKNSTSQEESFVAVTSFPLFEISNKLLKDKVEIKKLIPFGVETHAYSPSVKTMTQISKAEFFIYNGLGMEPWIKKAYENSLDMSQFVKLNAVKEDNHEGHQHHDKSDPHYWLEIENMIRMTSVLSGKFERRFPQLKKMIMDNEKKYIAELKILQDDYAKSLKTCKRREIVINHNAFGYLAHKYDFHTHALTGLSTDEQVSAKKMKEMTDLVKTEDVKIIFFESFVSSKASETISKETGATIQSLQPLANVTEKEFSQGYIFLMKENLKKLSFAMECE